MPLITKRYGNYSVLDKSIMDIKLYTKRDGVVLTAPLQLWDLEKKVPSDTPIYVEEPIRRALKENFTKGDTFICKQGPWKGYSLYICIDNNPECFEYLGEIPVNSRTAREVSYSTFVTIKRPMPDGQMNVLNACLSSRNELSQFGDHCQQIQDSFREKGIYVGNDTIERILSHYKLIEIESDRDAIEQAFVQGGQQYQNGRGYRYR